MATIEELEKRISKVEGQGKIKFFIQYLLSPILILATGTYINWRIDKAKAETQKIDLAQKMIGYIFTGNPTQAFYTERLMSKILDPDLAEELEQMVVNYYKTKIEDNVKSGNVVEAEQIVSAAKEIGGSAADKMIDSVKTDKASYQQILEFGDKRNMALKLEHEGFQNLANGKYDEAAESFKAAEKTYPSFHSMYELNRLIVQNKEQLNNPEGKKEILRRITDHYSFGAPPDLIEKIRKQSR